MSMIQWIGLGMLCFAGIACLLDLLDLLTLQRD